MKTKIFVLVIVTYDYYRFQYNVFGSTNVDDCILHYNNLKENYPLIRYKQYSKRQEKLDVNETSHYWIQSL